MCTLYRQGTSLLVPEAFWCLLAVSAFVNNNDTHKKSIEMKITSKLIKEDL